MLLNLSNHPSHLWPAAQRQAATDGYGAIQDMPFPAIPPAFDTDGVRLMVADYEARIRALALEHPRLVVHLMGELVFTHLLVTRLLAIGIPCVASTTERTVVEEVDGRKVSQFTFVRFRYYQ